MQRKGRAERVAVGVDVARERDVRIDSLHYNERGTASLAAFVARELEKR